MDAEVDIPSEILISQTQQSYWQFFEGSHYDHDGLFPKCTNRKKKQKHNYVIEPGQSKKKSCDQP